MNNLPNENQQYYTNDLEALIDLPNYQGAIMDYFQPFVRGNGVEFGAGLGTYSKQFSSAQEAINLVGPAQNLAKELRTLFAKSKNIQIFEETLEQRLASVEETS
jgi:hypothetical protein